MSKKLEDRVEELEAGVEQLEEEIESLRKTIQSVGREALDKSGPVYGKPLPARFISPEKFVEELKRQMSPDVLICDGCGGEGNEEHDCANDIAEHIPEDSCYPCNCCDACTKMCPSL